MKWEVTFVTYGAEAKGKVPILTMEYRLTAQDGFEPIVGGFDMARLTDDQGRPQIVTLPHGILRAMNQRKLVKVLHDAMGADTVRALEGMAQKIVDDASYVAAGSFIPVGIERTGRPIDPNIPLDPPLDPSEIPPEDLTDAVD